MFWEKLGRFCNEMSKNNKKDSFKKRFWNMKQIDRIEHVMHFERIEKHYGVSSMVGAVRLSANLGGFLAVMFCLLWLISKEYAINAVPAFLLVLKMLLVIMAISIPFDFVMIRSRNKKIRELNERFNLN